MPTVSLEAFSDGESAWNLSYDEILGFPNVEKLTTPIDVVIVGEEHHSAVSESLATRVISEEQDVSCVAIESTRGTISGGAMGAGCDMAASTGTMLAAIDTHWTDGLPPDARSAAVDVGNEFVDGPFSNGEVPMRDIIDARRAVYEICGEETHEALYEMREKDMARRLRWLHDRVGGTILVFVGAFHVRALADELRFGPQETKPVTRERLAYDDETSLA